MSEHDPTRREDPTGDPGDAPTTAFPSEGGVPPTSGMPPADPPPPPPGGVPPFAAGPPAGPGAPPVRRLQRSRQRRVVAGVAGGLGEYTGIDPVLFRVLFAVLTVFGGAGILLYVIGWLFLPDENEPVSPAESVIGRGRSGGRSGGRTGEAAEGVGLAIAALILAAVFLRGDAGDVVLVGVLIVGGVLLARHLDDRRSGPLPPPPAATGPPPPPPPYQAYQPYESPSGPATATIAPPPVTAPPVTAPPPKRRKERSILGLLTMSVVLLALGTLAAIDLASGDDDVQPHHYLALALGVIGLGLVVGAVRGRARGLVWLGVPLTIALLATINAESAFDNGTGDRTYRPLSAAEVSDRYELGVGSLLVDLTGVNFSEQEVTTTVDVSIGDVEVRVPPGVDVTVTGRSEVGSVELFGDETSGTATERTITDDGSDGPGGGTLDLRVEIGIGKVEVDRETP